MARQAKQYVEENEFVDVPLEKLQEGHAVTLQNEAELDHIKGAYTEDRDVVNQLMGQAQAFSAIQKLTTVAALVKIAIVKERKLYKALAGKTITSEGGEKLQLSGTFEEFCQMLGTSYSKVNEDLKNLAVFGEDALGMMNNAGIGYREMRKLRQLPEDVKEEFIEGKLVDLADKEAVADLIEELTIRHTKRLADKDSELKEAQEDSSAKDRIIAAKSDRENDLLNKIARYEGELVPPDERLDTLIRAVEEEGKAVDKHLRNLEVVVRSFDAICIDIFEAPLAEQDAAGARLAVSRLRDQLFRITRDVGRIWQFYENALDPIIAGHDAYLLPDQAKE